MLRKKFRKYCQSTVCVQMMLLRLEKTAGKPVHFSLQP